MLLLVISDKRIKGQAVEKEEGKVESKVEGEPLCVFYL